MQIRELAATQAFDFGFADLAVGPGDDRTFQQELITANCFCALPRCHPLAERDTISCQDLDSVPLGTLQSYHVMHQRTLKALRDAGATPNILLDSQFFAPLMQFISAGRCLSIVDPLTVVNEQETNTTRGEVVFRPMPDIFRYEYVILTPLYRPLSQLAKKIKEGWQTEVVALLDSIGAHPDISAIEDETEIPQNAASRPD